MQLIRLPVFFAFLAHFAVRIINGEEREEREEWEGRKFFAFFSYNCPA